MFDGTAYAVLIPSSAIRFLQTNDIMPPLFLAKCMFLFIKEMVEAQHF
jgi:hypothetical protein